MSSYKTALSNFKKFINETKSELITRLPKEFDVIQSIWLSTLVLSYEKSRLIPVLTEEDLIFKQVDIKNRAAMYCKQNVEGARISTWYCADHKNHTHAILRSKDDSMRRLVYSNEFGESTEILNFDSDKLIQTIFGEVRYSILEEFYYGTYTDIFKADKQYEIDLLSVFEFVENNKNKPYKDINKATPEEIVELTKLREEGSKATEELNKIANLCSKKFGLKPDTRSKWLDGSNTKVRSYLWQQLFSQWEPNGPISISLFVESNNDEIRFRTSLELNESRSKDADYNRFHNHLNKDATKDSHDLIYVAGGNNNQSSFEDLSGMSSIEVIERIKEGKVKKVQVSWTLEKREITVSSIEEIVNSVGTLIPYLELTKPLELYDKEEKAQMESNTNRLSNNLILFGPPGTGKTYNSVIYAVSIIENIDISILINEDYNEVFKRYTAYKKNRRIDSVTFHQSYGYEEFIEGIKPVIREDEEEVELSYEYSEGVFKSLCRRAGTSKVITQTYDHPENLRIWNVLLDGTGKTKLKMECFENDEIRIGWKDYDSIIDDSTPGLTNKSRRILLNFQDVMQTGDIVLIQNSRTTIDGIAVITGDYEFDAQHEYPRRRNVKWLMKDKEADILSINQNVALDRKTVYPLNRFTTNDVYKLIREVSPDTGIDLEPNNEPYVMIIDEINRGNISKIFGELITLIEVSKRIGSPEEATSILPYSKEAFGVPKNVYIIGTMNTADRSIALLDTALRRRFDFIEMMPDSEKLKNCIVDGIDIKLMLDAINRRIEILFDREHTIGHAYFMPLINNNSIEALSNIFKRAIIPLLQEYFYEDYEKIQLVLGDNSKEAENKFIKDEIVKINDVFKGKVDFDIPEKKYSIQNDAFQKKESYLGIYL